MRTYQWIIASAVAMALAGCGADEISSAGSGGNITVNNPPAQNPDPGTNPDPDPPVLATPAAGCPTVANGPGADLTDSGTIEGPTGTYRVCTMPSVFTASATLPRIPGLLYAMDGRTDVGVDRGAAVTSDPAVVLKIEPGVVIFASTGTTWLAVNRGNRIQAVGTAERPIVFTSRDNVLGLVDDDSHGQWGGVVLLGRAPITDCTVSSGATPGSINCERDTEGSSSPAYYGGITENDNSGTMSYVQLRYSGYVLSANNELQALTLSGTGSGTKIDHLQSHNSSDDGFENFGGMTDMRHIVVTGADDDSIDLDTGYRGTIQYIIAAQKRSGAPDSIIELDSANPRETQQPRTFMKIANFTFLHRSTVTANATAMLFRGRADATLVNGFVTSTMACLGYTGHEILDTDPAIQKVGPPTFASVYMQCGASPFIGNSITGTPITAGEVEATFTAGTRVSSTFASTLNDSFINGTNEIAAQATDPSTVDARFEANNYVGAVSGSEDTWYAGWTCNSATLNFGTTSGSCTSIPSLLD